MKRTHVLLIAVIVIAFVGIVSAGAVKNNIDVKITPTVLSEMQKSSKDDKIPVIIILNDQKTKSKTAGSTVQSRVQSIKSESMEMQKAVIQTLDEHAKAGKVRNVRPFWLINAVAVEATSETIRSLAQRGDVLRIEPDYKVRKSTAQEPNILPQDLSRSYPYSNVVWGVDWIEAPELWQRGINGSGINVSIIDTGINPHPDIRNRIVAFADFVKNNPYNGTSVWYSGSGADLQNTLETDITLGSSGNIVLEFYGKYAMDYTYDFGYVNVSTDNGVTWPNVATYKGESDGYMKEKIDLSSYSGTIKLRFTYATSPDSLDNRGWFVDDITVQKNGLVVFYDGAETGTGGFSLTGWSIKNNSEFQAMWPTGKMWYSGQGNDLYNTLEQKFDFTGKAAITLNFTVKYDTEPFFDQCSVQVSNNSGVTWSIPPGGVYSGYSTFINKSLDLTDYLAGYPGAAIRFLYTTDSSIFNQGCYIDQISIPEISYFDDSNIIGNWNAEGWYIAGPDTAYDDNGHGTHVAGTVAGAGKMGTTTGVAPGANLMGAKVLDATGSGYASDVLKGIEWSIDHGADVISLSLGMYPWDINEGYGEVNSGGTENWTIQVYSNPFGDYNTYSPDMFQPAFIIAEVDAYDYITLNDIILDGNLTVSLRAPNGTIVHGEPGKWMFSSGELPPNTWLYKFTDTKPLQSGTWTLEINSTSAQNISYYYRIGVGYPSNGSDVLSRALDMASDAGVVPVVAAGNNGYLGLHTIGSPGASKKAITVGAIRSNEDYIADFSSMGPVGFGPGGMTKPDVVAPGENIESLDLGTGYRLMSGTSMATPHISGVAALMLQRNRSLTPAQVKDIMMNSSFDLGKPGKDNIYGAGRVDALAAVSNSSSLPLPEPLRNKLFELYAGAAIDDIYVNQFINDSESDADGGIDIRGVSASLSGSYLTFQIYTKGIPDMPDSGFNLYLDTDKNHSTGEPVNDIGADYKITVNNSGFNGGYLYRFNNSKWEYMRYVYVQDNTVSRYVYFSIGLSDINQSSDNVGFNGVVTATNGIGTDTAPDSGHGAFPYANISIRMMGISWNDATGTPQSGTNLTFNVQACSYYPYYQCVTLYNVTISTDSSGIAAANFIFNQSSLYQSYYVYIWDDKGNSVRDYVYVAVKTPASYYPFRLLSDKNYKTVKNATVPIKMTLMTDDWKPYNENVTLLIGDGYRNVSVYLKPHNGTIEYDLNLSETDMDEYYYAPIKVLNGTLLAYDYQSPGYNEIDFVDRNYTEIKLDPDFYTASPNDKLDLIVESWNPVNNRPVGQKVKVELNWVSEVDVKSLGETVSPSILAKLGMMKKKAEAGIPEDLLTKEDKEELYRGLVNIKSIADSTSFFDVFTDSSGISRFNISVPRGAYYGFVYVMKEGSWYWDDSSYIFVSEAFFSYQHKVPSEQTGMNLWADWNAAKNNGVWKADNNFTVHLKLQKYDPVLGYSGISGETVYLYTTTGETKTVITDGNGSAKVNFTARVIDIKNSSYSERMVQVWGITGLLESGIAVANSASGYLNMGYKWTPVTLSVMGSDLEADIRFMDEAGYPISNVPSILDVSRKITSQNYWSSPSTADLLSEHVNSGTNTYSRTIPMTEYGTYSANVFSHFESFAWGYSYTNFGDSITYHPFNITSTILSTYKRNFTRPIDVYVTDKNGTPVANATLYLIENAGSQQYQNGYSGYGIESVGGGGGGGGGGYGSSCGYGSDTIFGYLDVNKTDANGKATVFLKTPDANNVWVSFRIGGATEDFSMPYIESGGFCVGEPYNRSDLIPEISMPAKVEAGKPVNITGNVRNYGDASSNSSVLRIYVDGVLLSDVSVPRIPAGQYSGFNVPWTPVNVDTYEIKAVADATNTNDEINEGNNNVSRTVYARMPDLVPIISAPSHLQLGESADIEIRVKNIGEIAAGTSKLSVQIDNNPINTTDIPSLAPDGEFLTTINWTPVATGTYSIKAVSDYRGEVKEDNESNNETTGVVDVVTLPDLTVELTVPEEGRVGKTINITATVRNIGTTPSTATKLSVLAGINVLQNISVPLLNGSESREYNVSWTPGSEGRRDIKAIIDPDGNVTELNSDNNIDIKHITVKFTDLAVSIKVKKDVILNSSEIIGIVVKNRGTMQSEPAGLKTYINSTNSTIELINETVPSIPAGDSLVYSRTWDATEAGIYEVNATLEDISDTDTIPENDMAEASIVVKGYNIEIWSMYYPYYPVYEENSFYISAYVYADHEGTVNASIYFDKPGLNVTEPNKTFTLLNSTYNYIWWLVEAETSGTYNATIEVNAFNWTSVINTTDVKISEIPGWGPVYYYPHGPINVKASTVVVKDLNSTTVGDSNSSTLDYTVFDVKEIGEPVYWWWEKPRPERSLRIDVSAGAEGRLLLGLEYLVGYPHGCPEQTMSPTQAAKRVEMYYLKRGALTEAMNDSLYQKVRSGVARMDPNGTANRQQVPGVGSGSGGWAWGLSTPSMFYTVYTHYGMGVILNNYNYSHLIRMYNISLNDSAMWIINNQNSDGSWTGSGYINGNVPMTGYVLMALNQTLSVMNETMYPKTVDAMQKGTAYLLSKQNTSNGGWNQGYGYYYYSSTSEDAYSTSLAVMGLLYSGNDSAMVRSAIDSGVGWLVTNQNSDGSWNKYPGSQSYSYSGDLAEATAYAALAINKSGIPSDSDENIIRGVRYLVGVYQDQGSWGSTKTTAAAVYALTELQVPSQFEKDVTIVLGNVVNQTIRLNETNSSATISSLDKPYLLKDRLWIQLNRSQLDEIGTGNHTINITTRYISGDDVTVLVGVDSRQNAHKKDALAKVPAKYIDPIADNFTLSLGLPDGIEEEDTVPVNATVTNKDSTGLYVMILEVPISANVSLPETSPENMIYYIENGAKIQVQNTYNVSEGKLFIYLGSDDESKPSVNASSSKSFYFNVTIHGFGQRTIEATVKPMYNDTLMALANVTANVKGFGNVTLTTLDENDTMISANVELGGNNISGKTKIIEGTYRFNVTKAGYIPVNTTVNVNAGSDKIYMVRMFTNLSEPGVVFSETNSTALPPSVSGAVNRIYNFTVMSSGGLTVTAMDIPANYTFLEAKVDGVPAKAEINNGTVFITGELVANSNMEITLKPPIMIRAFPGLSTLPSDPDSDGIFEDLNGNGRKDFNDVVIFFNNLEWIPDNEQISGFDFNGNERIDFADIVKLFEEV